jgi:hypothetical protein
LLLCLGLPGCFYDSRWGEAKRSQERLAARATPVAVAPAVAPDAATRELRVRFYATPAYAGQTVDYKKQIVDLIADANQVLVAAGARLSVEGLRTWDDRVTDEHLRTTLQELVAKDAAADVDLVVGLVGGLPRLTRSFHEEGMANVLGKHLVVRAPARVEEERAIDTYNELSEDDRSRVRRARKRHRALAVFLHEVGHVLGAVHETERHSVMFHEYATDMAGFSASNLTLMRAVVDAGQRRDAELASSLVKTLEGPGAWDPGERDAQLARLRAASAPPKAAVPRELEPLKPADRERLVEANTQAGQGDVRGAWERLKPLVETYPDVLAVQDLRCRLATNLFDWTTARKHCQTVMDLTMHPR